MTDETEKNLPYDGSDDETTEVAALPGSGRKEHRSRAHNEETRIASRSLSRIIRTAEAEHRRLEGLMQVARRLSGETDLDVLLTAIVEEAALSMDAERATVFLCDWEAGELYTRVAKELETEEIRMPIDAGLAGYVATTGEILNIEDAYEDKRFNQEIDRTTGFRTREVLSVPLRDRRDKVIGVLQVLNKRLPGPYDSEDVIYMEALAGIIAIALENVALYEEISMTLESLLEASSQAIDDRDPVTSGHSDRVTRYSLALARAIHECDDEPFREVMFTRARLKRLRYAAKLHDWGKISTSEAVLTKTCRLPANGMRVICERLNAVLADRQGMLLSKVLSGDFSSSAAEVEYNRFDEKLRDVLEFLERVDICPSLRGDDLEQLARFHNSGYLNDEEFRYLSVVRGNLTAEEWVEMRSHAEKTLRFLEKIRWPEELDGLPEVAAAHHERLNGSGYPLGLRGDEIPFDGKIMAVADVYDALTAHDRPYKPAIPHEKARKIMFEMVDSGHLAKEMVELFFEKECWKARNYPESRTGFFTSLDSAGRK